MAAVTAKTRRLGLAVMGLGLTLALAFAVGQARAADPTPITTGAGLDWGIKQSFRNYIEGPIAGGEITVTEGATRNPDGTFHFPVGEGTYDGAEKALTLRFDGSVHMSGHHGILDMTVRDPRVVITPEETSLYAKVASLPLGGGDLPDVADVHFGALDLTGVDPVVAAGTTTWTGVPAFVAAGAISAFAGHYEIGTAMDPLSFSYEGDGGKPEPAVETWTTQGSRIYDVVSERQPSGTLWRVTPLAYDATRDLLHVAETVDGGSVDTTYVQAVDPDTLESVGEPAVLQGFIQTPAQHITYDENDGAVLLWMAGTGLVEVLWKGAEEGYAVSELTSVKDVEIPPDVTRIRYDEANGRLYALLGVFKGEQGLMVLHKESGEWFWPIVHRDPEGFPDTEYPLHLNGRRITSIDVMTDGTVVLANQGGNDLGPSQPRVREALAYYHDNWGQAILEPIPETKATILDAQWVPNGTGPEEANTNGYTNVFAGPGNRLHLVEQGFYPQRVTTLRKSGWSWTVVSEVPTALPLQGQAIVTSDNLLAMSRIGTNTPVIGNGKVLGALPIKGNMAAGPDGSVYMARGVVLERYDAVGVSPTITDHPDDESVALAVEEDSTSVTFAAAASGTPAPALQWQTRPPGAKAASAWQPIAGETGPTLTVDAHREDSDRQYRALFRNEREVAGAPQLIGEIATDPATLTVDYAPSIVNQPEDASVVEGEDGVFKVMPAGAPYPQITWQRQVGGYWQNLDASTGDFEISGGLLTVHSTNTEMDGSLFRAKVSNSVATTFSNLATLSVASLPPSTVVGGHFDWGVKASFRNYIKGPIAKGSYEATAGAALNADGTVRFTVTGGVYDAGSEAGEVSSEGTVRFAGHDDGTGPKLNLMIADPRLQIQGATGTLFADVQSKALSGGALEQFPDVALTTLDLTGAGPTLLGKALRFSPVGATLTSAGAPAFAAFYPAGTALDPLSLTAEFDTTPVLPQAPPLAQTAAASPPVPSLTLAPTRKRAKAKAKHRRKAAKCKRGKRAARAPGKARCVMGKGKR